ncbi:MAG: YifB family Mg chelatase-like AAA ATPase [Alphaproteobacteria bacterium]|nr:YifB family Mg chelatase-like AAA ATPase [Alphaproteobacteria bacterium]
MISLNSIIFNGMDATRIDIQVQLATGLANPDFFIIGLADRAVKESAERVRNAMNALNVPWPPRRVTVNLSPADVEKSGSHFDLSILCGILCALDILPRDALSKYIIMGEIGLDGSILKTDGVLPASVWAKRNNMGIICPAAQGPEAKLSGLTDILAPRHVLDLINHFTGVHPLEFPTENYSNTADATPVGDMSDVYGQAAAKRALEIAAAGGHAMLMVGPPGSGKTMLASRLPGILPDMTTDEVLETSVIYSIAGKLPNSGLVTHRPFRAVHHTASPVSLAGGGSDAKPGEISLAHNGVLFLDELPEFNRSTLEILRQPMESGKIMISRARHNATYPANFQLIAAMNPCPCGHLGNAALSCTRAPRCAEAYQNKISGPLLDRIDLHVDVDAVNPWDMKPDAGTTVETSAEIRARVVAARRRQLSRQGCVNAQLDGAQLDAAVKLTSDMTEFLNSAAQRVGLSARGYNRVKRIARTIADLAGRDEIIMDDLIEALSYRPTNRGKYGVKL